jgi:glycerophosphoryl diester phosphodiesterase
MVLGIVWANGWLLLRWIVAVPVLMLDRKKPLQALAASSQLTRGRRRHTGLTLLAGLVLVVATPALVTLAFDLLAATVFRLLPDQSSLLIPAVVILLSSYLLAGLALTFLATSAFGTVVISYYRMLTGPAPEPDHAAPVQAPAVRNVWLMEAVVIVLVVFQGIQVVASLDQQDDVTITAHRGSPFKAPENTLAAINQAIEDGADYIEVDVQLTADGVPVLWHDNDMSRIFGLQERITEVRFEEIAQLDAGSWFDESFAHERIATLAQALDAVDNRAALFIDLKPIRNEQALVSTTIDLLREKNAIDGTVIAASDWPSLELAKSLEPDIRTALLAQFVVGPLWQDHYDILGLRFNRASPAAVARAHRAGNEFHVWTVNQPADMARFLDMGVDNIITDRPGVLADLLEQRENRTDAERLAMKVRNWLR